MIALEGLGLRRGAFALHDVDLRVPTGGYAVVIGPTGAGKSTLLELVAGHVRSDAGTIRIGGRDVTGLPPEARGVGVVYQHHHLFPHLDVRANIGYGLRGDPGSRGRVESLAASLDIGHLLDRRVGGLSGGERQRVALARALAPRPGVLVLDEPLASLDPSTRRRMREELRQVHLTEGTTVVHVTHDFEDALRLASLVAVLHDGEVVQQGAPDLVFRQPATPWVADFIGSGNVLAGRVTEAGGTALFEAGPVRLEVVTARRGPCHAMIRPEEVLVTRTALPSPPRNHLRGPITRIELAGALATVRLDVGVPLAAYLTRTSVDEMALAEGEVVSVAVKATAIHVM
jgi:molybdate transport system ATP-binding protein